MTRITNGEGEKADQRLDRDQRDWKAAEPTLLLLLLLFQLRFPSLRQNSITRTSVFKTIEMANGMTFTLIQNLDVRLN